MDKYVSDITEGALVADAYSLGAHWIYDPKMLAELAIDWHTLNDPVARWHSGKTAGQFTHYGDQLILLYEYALANRHFHLWGYMKKWFQFMRRYDGYIDAATRNTMDNIRAHNPLPCGFASEDLSVAGRIGPLMWFSENENHFIQLADLFTRSTHYTEVARACSEFCARALWRIRDGVSLENAFDTAAAATSPWMVDVLEQAKSRINESAIETIQAFGQDCNARHAMPGALYLALKYQSEYESAMIANARAGGDSSARGMVAGMCMTGAFGTDILPKHWRSSISYHLTAQAS